ncbi:MAG: PAS domain-containing protein, partial [Chloroflexota bacterium]|nr:PAS domain-containing protein [Chloroflexota bacterium]
TGGTRMTSIWQRCRDRATSSLRRHQKVRKPDGTPDVLRIVADKAAQHAAQIADLLAEPQVERSPDGVLAFDREYRYTMWNAAMERLSGVEKAAVLGRSALEVFPFLLIIGEDTYWMKVLAGQATEARHRPFSIPQTGREGYFDAWYLPLRDQSGTIVGILAVIRDVSARQQARQC